MCGWSGPKASGGRTFGSMVSTSSVLRALFEGFTATLEDDRFDYSERRFVSFGVLEGRTVAVAHAERDGVVRIISIRKATRREEESYFSAIAE
jgi:uncharacterized DUF497 family protein